MTGIPPKDDMKYIKFCSKQRRLDIRREVNRNELCSLLAILEACSAGTGPSQRRSIRT